MPHPLEASTRHMLELVVDHLNRAQAHLTGVRDHLVVDGSPYSLAITHIEDARSIVLETTPVLVDSPEDE
jgi:hypothetical protein